MQNSETHGLQEILGRYFTWSVCLYIKLHNTVQTGEANNYIFYVWKGAKLIFKSKSWRDKIKKKLKDNIITTNII